jgi:hypothetical protein
VRDAHRRENECPFAQLREPIHGTEGLLFGGTGRRSRGRVRRKE